jgi:hypothetical protein
VWFVLFNFLINKLKQGLGQLLKNQQEYKKKNNLKSRNNNLNDKESNKSKNKSDKDSIINTWSNKYAHWEKYNLFLITYIKMLQELLIL